MQTPASFSPDGKWLAYHEIASSTGRAIWIVQPDGDRKPEVFLKRPANESSPRFSPDGRWMAFVSDDSGRAQVCVRPFPGPGGTSQISTLGGTEPIWSRDGRELFYLNGDKLLAVNVTTNPTLLVGTPRELFSGRYDTSVTNVTSYDVSPDGRRFLRVLPPETKQNATDIQVVINWTEELKARVPAK
jgi:Tol biopolymer transport system component